MHYPGDEATAAPSSVNYSLGEEVHNSLEESLLRALDSAQKHIDGEEIPLPDEYNGNEEDEDDPFFCGDAGKWGQ